MMKPLVITHSAVVARQVLESQGVSPKLVRIAEAPHHLVGLRDYVYSVVGEPDERMLVEAKRFGRQVDVVELKRVVIRSVERERAMIGRVPSTLNLFTTLQFQDTLGTVRLEHWPEGVVLWVGGEIAWRSWETEERKPLRVKRRVRHRKGGMYGVVGELEMQVSLRGVQGARPIKDGDVVVAYQARDGKLWGRFKDEFEDGRFTSID